LINRDIDYDAIDVDVQAMFDPPELNENEGRIDSHKNTINAGNSVISEKQAILPSSPFKDKENDKEP
jgi:hypothetical protein